MQSKTISHGRFLETKIFPSLDGLRALSIIAVVWHHTHGEIVGWPITGRGFLGVDLFFEISGFLIVTLLLRERRRTGTINLRNFYVRRFLRIFPPYYAMLFVIGAVALIGKGKTSAATLHEWPFALLYVSNLVPMESLLSITWSLSTEEQFYLVVPAIQKRAKHWMLYGLPFVYILVVLPTFGLFPNVNMPPFFRQTTFGPILLGVLLAHLFDHPRSFGWIARALSPRWVPFVASAATLFLLNIDFPDISGWPRVAVHFAMLALLASWVLQEGGLALRLLSVWPLRRIGAVSYGIYLFHHFGRHFADKGLHALGLFSLFALFLLTLVGTWGLAEVSYRYFEVRFLALKERFSGSRDPLPNRPESPAPLRGD